MTRITIDIDKDSGGAGSYPTISAKPLAADKVGLLSSVSVSTELSNAFRIGFLANFETSDKNGYTPNGINNGKNDLQNNKNCKVIASVGGLVTHVALAAQGDAVPFVSLVGDEPANLGNCVGGVSLDSIKLNQARKAYLIAKGHAPANIYLLTNVNSSMHAQERAAWGNDPTFIESYAGTAGGVNTAANLSWDFNGDGGAHPAQIPAAAGTAVIFSDDPFFGSNRALIIGLVNTWLAANATRDVVYPSQLYASATNPMGALVVPRANQSALLGPDLKKAYQLLGILANCLNSNKNSNPYFGFFSVGSVTTPIT